MVAIAGITPDGFRWKLAPCLVVLVRELKERHPNRSTRSDGSIASAAHSKQNPTSDHEVDRKDGQVKALDLTDDPPRFDPDDFADVLIRRRDARLKYVIKDGMIWRSYAKPGLPAWVPEKYRGPNGHFSHAHISVTDQGARSTATWFPASSKPSSPPPPVKPKEQDDMYGTLIAAAYGEAGYLAPTLHPDQLRKHWTDIGVWTHAIYAKPEPERDGGVVYVRSLLGLK